MIIIRILSGPHAGKERVVRDNMYEGAEINPLRLLQQLVRLGSRWHVDFSEATRDEILEWGMADMVNRIMRAFVEGRPVFFQDKRYQASSIEEARRLSGEVEDAIVYSGHHVVVARDDENGVLIETGQREHPLM